MPRANAIRALIVSAAAGLALPTPALAQNALGDGRALDNNPGLGGVTAGYKLRSRYALYQGTKRIGEAYGDPAADEIAAAL